MPDSASSVIEPIGGFEIEGMMMHYNAFMPRLYNWCKSLGFQPGKVMPSRAFCSDESQGYPVIMMTKHFGTFPFNHGRVGGIVATKRHEPHAEHGEDIVIIQASHVGYDPDTEQFGTYRRVHTHDQHCGPNCGKVFQVLQWYQEEYQFAQRHILLHQHKGTPCVIIDNHLVRGDTENSLLLNLGLLVKKNASGKQMPLAMLSTSQIFPAADSLVESLGLDHFNQAEPRPFGDNLSSDMFYFHREINERIDGVHDLEHNLNRYMPMILTQPWPILTAAQINTQIEFDRTFRTIVKENAYHGKRVLFIAGLNIDISPQADQLFPLTKFIPWAAYVQNPNGENYTLEQQDVYDTLMQHSIENPEQIDLECAIQSMIKSDAIQINIESTTDG